MNRTLLWLGAFLLVSCSSTPPVADGPPWIRGATRTVDAGYIVYVGKGDNTSLDQANFQAESVAIADLANECSFAPKGARIEDHFDERLPGGVHRAWAKVGIVFEECEAAKKALHPTEIQRLANVAMTSELKRYQDLYYTAPEEPDEPEEEDEAVAGPPSPAERPLRQVIVIQDHTDYFVVRQRIAYAKQIVILSPPAYYAENAGRGAHFVSTVTPAAAKLQTYEALNPTVKSAPLTWSKIQADAGAKIPNSLSHAGPRAVAPPRTVIRPHSPPRQRHPRNKKRRRA